MVVMFDVCISLILRVLLCFGGILVFFGDLGCLVWCGVVFGGFCVFWVVCVYLLPGVRLAVSLLFCFVVFWCIVGSVFCFCFLGI